MNKNKEPTLNCLGYKYGNDKDFIRPKETLQDIISNDTELLNKKLKNFVEIHPDNYCDINCGTWIKYITKENKYRNGGIVICNKAPDYFYVYNPSSKFKWNVNLTNNTIFIKDEYGLKVQEMIEKNNLYKLYKAGYIKILDEPDSEFIPD